MAVLFVALGVGLLGFGLFKVFERSSLLAQLSGSAEGEVLERIAWRPFDGCRQTATDARLLIGFQVGAEKHTFESTCVNADDFKDLKSVPVRYSVSDPKIAALNTFQSQWGECLKIFGWAVTLVVIGTLILIFRNSYVLERRRE